MLEATALLRAASDVWDADATLRTTARRAALGGFAGSAAWMGEVIRRRRAARPVIVPFPTRAGTAPFAALGAVKYALFAVGVAGPAAVAWTVGSPWPLVAALAAFCAAEAWMVFLFPVALDGAASPFRASRSMTLRSGGAVRVASIVLPISASMLLGGFARRGFLRSWCLGCVAVALWYEHVLATGAAPIGRRG